MQDGNADDLSEYEDFMAPLRQAPPGYKIVYVPLSLVIGLLVAFLGYSIFVSVRDTFGEPSNHSFTVPWGEQGQKNPRPPIAHGDLWCVLDTSAVPASFQPPKQGVCDALVFCCIQLTYLGFSLEGNGLGPDGQRLKGLVELVAGWRSLKAKIFGIAGRRSDTPKMRNLPGALPREVLVDRMASWVREQRLDGVLMNYDNSANNYYGTVMHLLHRRLHRDGRWLIQIFDYNDADRSFSAGAFAKRRMEPVVRKGHDYMDDYTHQAYCPVPYDGPDDSTWSLKSMVDEYGHMNNASFGHDYFRDTMLTMSLAGYHYRLDDPKRYLDGSPATRMSVVSYETVCLQQKLLGVTVHSSNLSDCLVVRQDRDWYSIVGPDSYKRYQLMGSFLSLIVYDIHLDDHMGKCGRPFPLLRAAKEKLKMYSKSKAYTIT